MAAKEHIIEEIEDLDETQLREVENYLAFLKFRSRLQPAQSFDKNAVEGLYREFAAEDRSLAEEGMAEYARDLKREDDK
jgi:hypothetical protein